MPPWLNELCQVTDIKTSLVCSARISPINFSIFMQSILTRASIKMLKIPHSCIQVSLVDNFGTVIGKNPDCLLLSGTVVGDAIPIKPKRKKEIEYRPCRNTGPMFLYTFSPSNEGNVCMHVWDNNTGCQCGSHNIPTD